MQIILNFYVILAGKVILGFAGGIMITSAALYLEETVPQEVASKYGFGINVGVTVGISIIEFGGFILPTDEEALRDESNWLIIAFVPPTICLVNLILWMTLIRVEPLLFCVKQQSRPGMEVRVLENLRHIYTFESSDDVYEGFTNMQQRVRRNEALINTASLMSSSDRQISEEEMEADKLKVSDDVLGSPRASVVEKEPSLIEAF